MARGRVAEFRVLRLVAVRVCNSGHEIRVHYLNVLRVGQYQQMTQLTANSTVCEAYDQLPKLRSNSKCLAKVAV